MSRRGGRRRGTSSTVFPSTSSFLRSLPRTQAPPVLRLYFLTKLKSLLSFSLGTSSLLVTSTGRISPFFLMKSISATLQPVIFWYSRSNSKILVLVKAEIGFGRHPSSNQLVDYLMHEGALSYPPKTSQNQHLAVPSPFHRSSNCFLLYEGAFTLDTSPETTIR